MLHVETGLSKSSWFDCNSHLCSAIEESTHCKAAGEMLHIALGLSSLEMLQGCGFLTQEETGYMGTVDKTAEKLTGQEATSIFFTKFYQ